MAISESTSTDTKKAQDPPPNYVEPGVQAAGPAAGPEGPPQTSTLLANEEGQLIVGQNKRRFVAKRFFKAFVLAGVIWILLSSLLRGIKRIIHRRPSSPHYQVPYNARLEKCTHFDEWTRVPHSFEHSVAELPQRESDPNQNALPFTSTISGDLSISHDALWFVSKGPYSQGHVDIVTSPDQKEDTVTYRISVHYSEESVRDLTKICKFSVGERNEWGIGIFTPDRNWNHEHPRRIGRDRLLFETTIILPESTEKSPVFIKKLASDADNTSIRTSNLSSKVYFEDVELRTLYAPIDISSLQTKSGTFSTSNAPIRGTFNATNTLFMYTSNADIKAVVGLTSTERYVDPAVYMYTTTGQIDGQISLLQSADHWSPGSFRVTAGSSSAPIALNIASAPVDSKLALKALTSHQPIHVSLPPAYEGSIDAQTSHGYEARVKVNKDVEDPKGDERKRRVTFEDTHAREHAKGEVVWGNSKEQERDLGSVKLETVKSDISIKL